MQDCSHTLWIRLHLHRSKSRSAWPRWMTHPAPECHVWRPWLNNYGLPSGQTKDGAWGKKGMEERRKQVESQRKLHQTNLMCSNQVCWPRPPTSLLARAHPCRFTSASRCHLQTQRVCSNTLCLCWTTNLSVLKHKIFLFLNIQVYLSRLEYHQKAYVIN